MLSRGAGALLSRRTAATRRALQTALQSFFAKQPLRRQALLLATHPLGGVGNIRAQLAASKTLEDSPSSGGSLPQDQV